MKPAGDGEVPAELQEFIRRLPGMLGGAADEAALAGLVERIAAVPGVTRVELGRVGWANVITIEPIDAGRVAEILGLVDPHIVSTDVHQHSWSIVVRSGDDVVDEHGHRRITADSPRYGAWKLRISVAGRTASRPVVGSVTCVSAGRHRRGRHIVRDVLAVRPWPVRRARHRRARQAPRPEQERLLLALARAASRAASGTVRSASVPATPTTTPSER